MPLILLALLILPSAPALAHDREEGPALDLLLVASLSLPALAYAVGAVRRCRRAGARRSRLGWRALAFAGGIVLLGAALAGPFERLAAASLAAHMVQHVILLTAAPVLVLFGRPLAAILHGLPLMAKGLARSMLRRPWWRWLKRPMNAALIQAAAVWLWHLPGPFNAALADPMLHALEHATFLAAGLLFWASILTPARGGYGAATLSALFTLMHSGALSALIALAPRPLYETHGIEGLTSLEDQQLAGLIMWVPAGLFYVAAGLFVLMHLLEKGQRPSDWSATQR
jgi:putative membrane protein